uniref:Uncharacterized protein n=1 Tax=Chenopodium quinoa TaxID=63459 RepID=A0A803LVY8_CHEQI
MFQGVPTRWLTRLPLLQPLGHWGQRKPCMSEPIYNRWIVAPEEYEVEDEEIAEVDMITVNQIDKED